MLRRNLELPGFPLASDSSGGSERGLEVVVNGLPGGLVSSAELAVVLNRDSFPKLCIPEVCVPKLCVFKWASRAGDMTGEFRARSQKCSNGRMTRVYEFLIWVDKPGMPR